MTDETTRWWLAPPGMQPEGPFSHAEIRSRVDSAPQGTDWQVCMEGSVDWRPLADLPGFHPSSEPPPVDRPTAAPASKGINDNYIVIMHLSQFANYLLPLAGFVLPIVLWIVKKDEDEAIDRQGREIANWLIFELIAALVCGILIFVIIGIPLLIVLGILGIVFPIMGAVKASNGEFYRYPMMFRILN
jgi:hypothetical protein